MKPGTGAGESRPSRRRVLNTTALATIAIAVLLTIGRGDASDDDDSPLPSQDQTRSDAQIAADLLQRVEGADPVLCAAVDRAFSTGYWGHAPALPQPGLSGEAAETSRWLGKRKIERDALPVAQRAFSHPDACVRRVAARIAANVQSVHLANDLKAELAAAAVETRLAAIMALGYAGQESSLATVLPLLEDPDPAIRMHAAWALGSIAD